MKLARIEGPATVMHCDGCARDGMGGSEPYLSAATGEARAPEEWYQDEDPLNFGQYCSECAAKMVSEDPTRSKTQFYDNTTGTQITAENLPEF